MKSVTKNTSDGFTLVEVLIVVAILGILAAVIIPEYTGYAQKAKESAAKENLQLLRTTIERYAIEHNGVPPGYWDDDPTSPAAGFIAVIQLTDGYLSEIPENPFNNLNHISAVMDNADFPDSADNTTGWTYKPLTHEIRLNYTGTDSEGKAYFSY